MTLKAFKQFIPYQAFRGTHLEMEAKANKFENVLTL